MSLTSDGRLPLKEGDRGPAVLDLQLRLAELDNPCTDPPGEFKACTSSAIRAFQEQKGLPANGVCDHRTWAALVGAGYALGDRLLYHRNPMLRGDDVAELQRRLSALGFDPGRIDGIYGDHTVEAVRDFQRNAGLPVDGIAGHRTILDLVRLELRDGGSDLVSHLRERIAASSNSSRGFSNFRVGVGETGGFSAGVEACCRVLRDRGAQAFAFHDPDPSRQAAAANAAGLHCFVSLLLTPGRESCTTAFYSGFRYESKTSRKLAGLVQQRLPAALELRDGGVCGLALPILRETAMSAVEIQLGDPSRVVERTADLAKVVVTALQDWLTYELSEDNPQSTSCA